MVVVVTRVSYKHDEEVPNDGSAQESSSAADSGGVMRLSVMPRLHSLLD